MEQERSRRAHSGLRSIGAVIAGGSPALQSAGARYLVQTWTRDPHSTPFATNLPEAPVVELGP